MSWTADYSGSGCWSRATMRELYTQLMWRQQVVEPFGNCEEKYTGKDPVSDALCRPSVTGGSSYGSAYNNSILGPGGPYGLYFGGLGYVHGAWSEDGADSDRLPTGGLQMGGFTNPDQDDVAPTDSRDGADFYPVFTRQIMAAKIGATKRVAPRRVVIPGGEYDVYGNPAAVGMLAYTETTNPGGGGTMRILVRCANASGLWAVVTDDQLRPDLCSTEDGTILTTEEEYYDDESGETLTKTITHDAFRPGDYMGDWCWSQCRDALQQCTKVFGAEVGGPAGSGTLYELGPNWTVPGDEDIIPGYTLPECAINFWGTVHSNSDDGETFDDAVDLAQTKWDTIAGGSTIPHGPGRPAVRSRTRTDVVQHNHYPLAPTYTYSWSVELGSGQGQLAYKAYHQHKSAKLKHWSYVQKWLKNPADLPEADAAKLWDDNGSGFTENAWNAVGDTTGPEAEITYTPYVSGSTTFYTADNVVIDYMTDTVVGLYEAGTYPAIDEAAVTLPPDPTIGGLSDVGVSKEYTRGWQVYRDAWLIDYTDSFNA
ncbi:MAG: hypothetical protein JWO31_1828 [Phycisphaerales bacterium]|nr:hypothetical protein [Phycisphaerales bacterium]